MTDCSAGGEAPVSCVHKKASREWEATEQHWAGDVIKLLPSLKLKGCEHKQAQSWSGRSSTLLWKTCCKITTTPVTAGWSSSRDPNQAGSSQQLLLCFRFNSSHSWEQCPCHTIASAEAPAPSNSERESMHLPCVQWTRQSSDQRRMRSLLITKVSTLHFPSLGRGLWSPDDGLNTKLMHGESTCRAGGGELQLRQTLKQVDWGLTPEQALSA